MNEFYKLIKSSKDQRLEVGHTIHHPVYGEGVLKGSWGDVINIYFAEHDRVITVHDNDNLFIVRISPNSWSLLSKADADRISKLAEAERLDEYNKLQIIFQNDFLKHAELFQKLEAKHISFDEHQQYSLDFVRKWMQEICIYFNKDLPDDEQLLAISSVAGNYQVVARAGSGKTTTLVYRTLFLLKHCKVDASQILILAFNRKAALEIRRRLLGLIDIGADAAITVDINSKKNASNRGKKIDKGEIEASAINAVSARLNIILPHVMTFHALAYAIVHPEESILFNGAEGESQGLSRVFQQIIDDHLQDNAWRGQIQELMLAHFREDWDRIVAGKYDQSKEELLQFRRSLPRESIGGDYVKSFGEKLIADFLFEHDISYKYERNHFWKDINYRPDFTIFKSDEKRNESGLIIEYFGLKGDVDYDEMSNDKRDYWAKKKNWDLIEFYPEDIVKEGVDSFLGRLKSKIEMHGVKCEKLTDDEIWQRIRDRAIDRFTSASVNFIGRCRKQSLTPSKLQTMIESYSSHSPVEAMFLNIACQLYSSYLERMAATGEDDFDGLMQRAAEIIISGNTNFQRKSGNGNLAVLKYLCIDEFQDFSELFYKLLDAIRYKNPSVELFCVGDDWQAINGFAGSDLKYFIDFDKYIGNSQLLYLSTNYRSSRSIVSVGNALMSGFGKPAVAYKKTAGAVLLSDLKSFQPTIIEKQRHPGDIITPAVIRIVNQALMNGKDVVLLSRRNALPWYINFQEQAEGSGRGLERFLNLVRSYFPKDLQERISISTAHKYKGLEKPTVIVLDAVVRSYPLIHPDWVFSRILGDSAAKITEEERRLFYVALTRAVDTLVVITEDRNISPFLNEIQHLIDLTKINWGDFHAPANNSGNSRLVVNVSGNTFPIKDQLIACGYHWHALNRCWEKTFPKISFTIDLLKGEPWSTPANNVEIRVFSEKNTIESQYYISDDNWYCDL